MSLTLRSAVVLAALAAVSSTAPANAENPWCVLDHVSGTPTQYSLKPIVEDPAQWAVDLAYAHAANLAYCIEP